MGLYVVTIRALRVIIIQLESYVTLCDRVLMLLSDSMMLLYTHRMMVLCYCVALC